MLTTVYSIIIIICLYVRAEVPLEKLYTYIAGIYSFSRGTLAILYGMLRMYVDVCV